jgi:hypothetical protein
MQEKDRTNWVMLGMLCLMPALFFWVINGLPIDMHLQSIPIFDGSTRLEFLICTFFFPLISIGLGWTAYRHREHKTNSLIVIAVGLIEFVAAIVTAFLGAGI